jgi:hypothetical protein
MVKSLKIAIDNKDWPGLVTMAKTDPKAFFSGLTLRYMHKQRLEWLRDISGARYEANKGKPEYSGIDLLILNACDRALGLSFMR